MRHVKVRIWVIGEKLICIDAAGQLGPGNIYTLAGFSDSGGVMVEEIPGKAYLTKRFERMVHYEAKHTAEN